MRQETKMIEDQLSQKLIGRDGLIQQDDLDKLLFFVNDEKNKIQIREELINLNLIEFSKGLKSYNSLQHRIKEYIEKQLPQDLIDKGSSTFKASENEIETIREEKEGICTLNKNGQLVRIVTSMDNVTDRRISKRLKEATEPKK